MSPPPEASQTIEEAFQQGLTHHRAGNLNLAETLYRAVLDVAPEHMEANFNLGLLAIDQGQPQAGLGHFRNALQQGLAERYWLGYLGALYLSNQKNASRELLALGRKNGLSSTVADALSFWLEKSEGTIADLHPLIKSVLSVESESSSPAGSPPDDDGVNALLQSFSEGRYREAEAQARKLVLIHPTRGFFWKVLGATLWQQGQVQAAIEPMLKSVELMPDDQEALCNLGAALDEVGHPEEAEVLYRRVLSINPEHADALNNLGDSLRQRHRLDEAQGLLLRALRVRPAFPEALNNLGCLLHTAGDLAGARHHLDEALRLRPSYPDALINLSNVQQDEKHFLAAERSLRQALALNANLPVALNNLGNLLNILGRGDEAEMLFGQALALKPHYFDASSNLLFNLNYGERGTPKYRLEEARRFGRQATLSAGQPYETWNVDLQPGKLRIGLVSGDLCNHPVGFFLVGVLEELANTSLEIVAYPTRNRDDDLSQRIRRCCRHWHPLAGLDDRTAAGRVHQDGIHILLDLSGHTAYNRLPMFARRPAPIQASWLGYFATTGVQQMDYVLADRISVPPEHQAYFNEAIQYLPETRLCFTPPENAPPVAELPALRARHLTFGSFQNLAKANDKVFAAWSAILAAFDGSRLRWQCKQFSDPGIVAETLERLRRYGISGQQVSLHGSMPRDAYLAAHDTIDFILDTFPYPGGTTTCEALWMGVPTLTLAGDSMHSRQGASLMTAAGLPEWVAISEEEYVQAALRLGKDLGYLSNLRARLRPKVATSPLFDAKRFSHHLTQALWDMWRHYSECTRS